MGQSDTQTGKSEQAGAGLVTLLYSGLEARRAGAPNAHWGGDYKTMDEHMEQNQLI